MTQTAVNYARALYELGVPGGDVREMERVLRGSSQLMAVLESPLASQTGKERAIGKIFPSSVQNFVKITCRNGKIGQIFQMCEAYEAYRQKQEGQLEAELFYVTLPSEEQLEQMKEVLEKKHGKKEAAFVMKEDKSLLGGFLLRAGGLEYDYSLKGRLNRLEQKLIRR